MRDLARIDPPVARRIVEKLERAADRPEHYLQRLASSDEYKLRTGDYRLLAVLSHPDRTILVERVDHRSRVCERER